MERRALNPRSLPDTIPYGFSQAILSHGGWRVHLSGQVGVNAEERTVGPNLESQTRAALDNVEALLRELAGNLSNVVMLRIYIVESARGDQRFIGHALRARFPVDPPATSWIVVNGLADPEWLVEIEAEAVVPEQEPRT